MSATAKKTNTKKEADNEKGGADGKEGLIIRGMVHRRSRKLITLNGGDVYKYNYGIVTSSGYFNVTCLGDHEVLAMNEKVEVSVYVNTYVAKKTGEIRINYNLITREDDVEVF